MPDHDITRNNAGRTGVVRSNGNTTGSGNFTTGQHGVLKDISTMKTFLQANGYTATTTAAMTKNDLIYATINNSAFAAL